MIKDILWVEDFSEQPAILSDDLTASADRTAEVQSVFGEFSQRVTVLENITNLPEHIEKHPQQYALFVLDLDLSQSIPRNSPADWDTFVKELGQNGVNVQDLQPENLATLDNDGQKATLLGLRLAYYLIQKQVKASRIVFLSAFRETDLRAEEDDLLKALHNSPFRFQHFYKSNISSFQGHLMRQFHIQELVDDESAIMAAKELLRRWMEYDQNCGDDAKGTLFMRGLQNVTIPDRDTHIGKIQKALDSRPIDFYNILRAAAQIYDHNIKFSGLDIWEIRLLQTLKGLRNVLSHRSLPAPSREDFLLLSVLVMRVLFERKRIPFNSDGLWPEEQVLFSHLKSGRAFPPPKYEIEDVILDWYWEAIPGFFFDRELDSKQFKYAVANNGYEAFVGKSSDPRSLQAVSRLFCAGAEDIHITVTKRSNTDPAKDPSIQCYFQVNRGSGVPAWIRKLADAYIVSQKDVNRQNVRPPSYTRCF